MRGKGQLCKRHVLGGGITPAYAGKSSVTQLGMSET